VASQPIQRPEDELSRALASIAPAGVVTGARRINGDDVSHLAPAELAAVERATAVRRHEFASGRWLLRSLLGSADPILVRPDRRPQLPAGACASLAHDSAFVVAAVTRDPRIVALGVDIERVAPLAIDVAALILRRDERDVDPLLAFTLKEAVYKCWANAGGDQVLEHHDVRLDVSGGRFSARVDVDGSVIAGRHARVGDRWVALAVTPM
jgi:4'-phosphopantetheinyl transferase EntD